MNGNDVILDDSGDMIAAEVDAVLWTRRLQTMRRRNSRAETPSTIAEQCWSVADSVTVLAPNFPYIHRNHAVELACVLGKIEVVLADAAATAEPESADPDLTRLVHRYVERLAPPTGRIHQALLLEAIECKSPEARFVKAVDEIESLSSMLLTRGDKADDECLRRSATCADAVEEHFPPLHHHANELLRRIVRGAADERGVDVTRLWDQVGLHDAESQTDAAGGGGRARAGRVGVPAKAHRMKLAFEEVSQRPPAQAGLEAYRQISDAINRVEDLHWGRRALAAAQVRLTRRSDRSAVSHRPGEHLPRRRISRSGTAGVGQRMRLHQPVGRN